MENFYNDRVLDHYRNPRNKGELENPSHVREENNPLCGDTIRISLVVGDHGTVDQIMFDGEGCAVSLASASMLTEMVKGKNLEDVERLNRQDVLDGLGVDLNASRRKCALLALKALKGALGYESTSIDEDEADW